MFHVKPRISPVAGDSFDLVDAGSFIDGGYELHLPPLPANLWWVDRGFEPDGAVRVRCRADINDDGVFDIDDFIDFQTHFALGNMIADYNDDGVLDINDFIVFQTMFVLGCN